MSLKSGFFNSINQDRGYTNKDLSKIFDGVIMDGIYSTVGNMLTVKSYEDNSMRVYVDTGRAWFHHTWVWNDAPYGLTIPDSSPVFNRIDAIVLEIDHTDAVRACSLKVEPGEPAVNPERPTLKKDDDQEVWQEVLAYVEVRMGETKITQTDITNMVGTSITPFVTGPLTNSDIDNLLARWSHQLDLWLDAKKQEVTDWFSNLQVVLDGDVATHLQNQIDNFNWSIQSLTDRVVAAENRIIVGPEDVSEHADLPEGSIYFQYEE